MQSIVSQMTSFLGESGEQVSAYVARPEGRGKDPGLIVIHEIWGLVDHIKDVANRFAREGYAALAPNLFSTRGLATTFVESNVMTTMQFLQTVPLEKRGDRAYIQQQLSAYDETKRATIQKTLPGLLGLPKNKLTQDLVKAVEYLNSQNYVRQAKVGSIGFCFGGGMSISLACHAKLAACVLFYGENPEPIDLVKNIDCPVLGIYGGEDMRINQNLDKLVKVMVEYKKDFEMRIYHGAPHAFFNDARKTIYREEAAKDAWERALLFFKRTLF